MGHLYIGQIMTAKGSFLVYRAPEGMLFCLSQAYMRRRRRKLLLYLVLVLTSLRLVEGIVGVCLRDCQKAILELRRGALLSIGQAAYSIGPLLL